MVTAKINFNFKNHCQYLKEKLRAFVVFGQLDQSHNQPIKRDKKFMKALLPILDESWKKVIYYRINTVLFLQNIEY